MNELRITPQRSMNQVAPFIWLTNSWQSYDRYITPTMHCVLSITWRNIELNFSVKESKALFVALPYFAIFKSLNLWSIGNQSFTLVASRSIFLTRKFLTHHSLDNFSWHKLVFGVSLTLSCWKETVSYYLQCVAWFFRYFVIQCLIFLIHDCQRKVSIFVWVLAKNELISISGT